MDDTKKLLLAVPATIAAFLVAQWYLQRRRKNRAAVAKKALYQLDHSVLNIPLPLQSMWMNMGYWKDTDDFPTACRALLERVLSSARIFHDPQESASVKSDASTLSILDLGFGCGDQCLYIRHNLQQELDSVGSKRLKAYVGLTLEESHLRIAQQRLQHEPASPLTGDGAGKAATFDIFCADAAKPASWNAETKAAISCANQVDEGIQHHETWVLGLDTLYHFQPSRWSVIGYASQTLGASLMAFDLFTANNLTPWQRIVLKVLTVLGQSPSANWVTIEEYRDRLVAAGYARENIKILDISDHVFGPLHRFMKKREEELEQHGMSIGRYRHAAKMFGWWHRTGAVRGCIVVARK
ncbi:hypothetical protein DM02DRAFT_526324 [Periconia macrospinosa]|uniref:S-adenosyl-L-methionine-dependent methyltransferase n=1 Tax=Periconia macrospinosa TaxID=97972 RepID=A0A2V1DVC4_9PLEO|nr:hypothetical protein DM02DRAFT_526324 [Periconia macrospinosa]